MDKKFIVVQGTDIHEFEEKVNGFLMQGFKLHGNMMLSKTSTTEFYDSKIIYTQALLKPDDMN